MQRIAHIEDGYIVNVSLAKEGAELKPGTMLESDAIAQGYSWRPITEAKRWQNVQEFMAEFTMPEKGAIALSMDPTIAAMRLELTTWLSEVHADDPRVVAGISRIVELGIITPERKNTILSL